MQSHAAAIAADTIKTSQRSKVQLHTDTLTCPDLLCSVTVNTVVVPGAKRQVERGHCETTDFQLATTRPRVIGAAATTRRGDVEKWFLALRGETDVQFCVKKKKVKYFRILSRSEVMLRLFPQKMDNTNYRPNM